MKRKKHLEMLGILALVFSCQASLRAATLSGTVVDPQQLVIPSVEINLVCGSQTEIRRTDGRGHFTFSRNAFPEDCTIRATHPGFAALKVRVGRSQVLTLQLQLAEVKETIAVEGNPLAQNSLAAVSLSGDELRTISDNSEELVKYAKELAGIQSGPDHMYVDGLPTDHLPPAKRIESITINADPFSSEFSDGSDTHIDIATKRGERKFQLSGGGLSMDPGERDGLNSRLSSVSRTGRFGLMGPVPDLPIVFTSDVDLTDRIRKQPIEAVVPAAQMPANPVVRGRDSSALVNIGADYSKNDTLRVNTALYLEIARHSNPDVSGLTLPEAGTNQGALGRELRTTFRKVGRNYIYRGGIDAEWSNRDLKANSSSLGIAVSGAFIAGGAEVSREKTQKTRWTLKNVAETSTRKHYWAAGLTITRLRDDQLTLPNPFGTIHFDNLQQYVSSKTAGANNGTWLVTRGLGDAAYSSSAAAPFAEAEILRGVGMSLRGGLRADYQTGGGLLLSPRLSAIKASHGFLLKSGVGMFVQNWTNNMFLTIIEHDGHHLQPFITPAVSLSDVEGGDSVPESRIVSKVASNLVSTRDWVFKASVEHPFGRLLPGVEYTWTNGTHLLGSQRLSVPGGWTDVLESNRSLRKEQVHLRTQYDMKGQRLTAHYEWVRARNNTDGPFSFPAKQGDLHDEWAPASGIARHNLILVGSFSIGKMTSLTLAEIMRSPVPLNIISGIDAEENGLYTDRAGRPRNSGRGPSYNSLELFAHRRIALPRIFSSRDRKYIDIGVHGENLLGIKNYVSVGTVIGSPLLGRPLTALPGRSFRLSLNLD